MERIAQKDIEASCGPMYDHDCWSVLFQSIQHNPYNYRITVSGYDTAGPHQIGHSLSYNRQLQVLEVDESLFNEQESYKQSRTYENVNDELLHRFSKVIDKDSMFPSFNEFCKANGCHVVNK